MTQEQQIEKLQNDVTRILAAVSGSDLSPGGLIHEVKNMKLAMNIMDARLDKVEKRNNVIYVMAAGIVVGIVIGAAIFGIITWREALSIVK